MSQKLFSGLHTHAMDHAFHEAPPFRGSSTSHLNRNKIQAMSLARGSLGDAVEPNYHNILVPILPEAGFWRTGPDFLSRPCLLTVHEHT